MMSAELPEMLDKALRREIERGGEGAAAAMRILCTLRDGCLHVWAARGRHLECRDCGKTMPL